MSHGGEDYCDFVSNLEFNHIIFPRELNRAKYQQDSEHISTKIMEIEQNHSNI